jgi:hypothetical protein
LSNGAPASEPFIVSADIQLLADLGNSYELVRTMRIAPLLKMLYLSGCSHAFAYSNSAVNHDATGRTAETAFWHIVLKWIFVDTLLVNIGWRIKWDAHCLF